MKPVAFDYCRADSVEDALSVLHEHGTDASVLAGGLSLGPMLNMRLVRPAVVVDVNYVQGLDGVEVANGWVATGALLRQADAMNDADLCGQVPLLHEALPHLGHYQTRSRGTFGGSMAHADPSAELPLALVTLGGEVELASRRRRRTVRAREFFLGILTTARAPDEMIVKLRWPGRAAATGYAFQEIARRRGDFAIAAAACAATLKTDGTVAAISLGLGGVEDRPMAVDLADVVGAPADAELVSDVVERVRRGVAPIEDMSASAEYRAQLAGHLAGEVVARAFQRVMDGG